MKKALSLVLALIMVVAAFAVFTVTSSADDKYDFADGVLTLKADVTGGYSSSIGRDTYPWGKNNDGTGADLRDKITKIIVADGVTKIDKMAFVNCVNLKVVELGKDLVQLGNGCFKGCTALETIIFKAPLQKAGNDIVDGCTSLKSITLVDQSKAMFFEVLQQGTGNVGTAESPKPFNLAEYTETGNTKPQAPDHIENLTISPMYGNIENWPGTKDTDTYDCFGEQTSDGQYQYRDSVNEEGKKILGSRTLFIVGGIDAGYQKKMMGDEPMAYLRVCVTDETTGKIYLIDRYLFNYSQGREFYGDSFIRLDLPDYGVPVDNKHTYTISLEIYNPDPEDPFVYAAGKSAVGAFKAGSNELFVLNNAIVPDPLQNPGAAVEVAEDPINVAPAEAYVLEKIETYENGMENWTGSPNKGDKEAVTQILFSPYPWDPILFDVGLEVTVNMKANDGSSDDTFTLPVATVYNGGSMGILRLEPCLMKSPWVPVKDKEYTATFTFDDGVGGTVSATAVNEDGTTAVYKITEEPIDPTAFAGTLSGEFTGKSDAKFTWTLDDATKTLTISGTGAMEDFANSESSPWAAYAGVIKALVVSDGVTRVGKCTASGSAIETATFAASVKELAMDSIAYCENLKTVSFGGPIETIGQGVVYASDNLETVSITGQTKAEFLTVASVKNYNDAFKKAKFIVDGKPDDEPVVEPTTVGKFGDGMENWPGSPNKEGEDAVTQILLCPKPWNNDVYKNYAGKTVTITMEANGKSDTFTLPVATVYPGGSWGILRVEPCLMETPWVPVKDVEYTLTLTFENADGETVTVKSGDTFKLAVDPIVPGGTVEPTPTPTTPTPTVTPVVPTTVGKFGDGMENWPGSPNKEGEDAVTQILLCPKPWNNDVYKNYAGKMVTITMEANGKSDTFTLPVATVYPGGSWGILRVEPCLMETPWVPVKDVEYTLTLTFENADGETVTVKSDDTFKLAVDPIVPGGIEPTTETPVVVEPTKLGGYLKAAGNTFEMYKGKVVLAYDFDVAPVESIKFWENKGDYTFTVTFFDENGEVVATVVEEPVNCASWGATDNNLYFEVPFMPELDCGYGMKVEIVKKDGSESYWVEEKYGDNSGAVMSFEYVEIDKDYEGTFEGKNGETLTWKVKKDNKTLYISGEGEMPDFGGIEETPWGVFAYDLKAIRVRKGVTRVGKNTASHTTIETAYFEEGVTEIAMDAIAYCNGLEVVYLPSTLAKIGQGTVYNSSGITNVNYNGTKAQFDEIPKGPYNDNLYNGFTENVAVPTGVNTAIFVVLAILAILGAAVVVTKKVFSK